MGGGVQVSHVKCTNLGFSGYHPIWVALIAFRYSMKKTWRKRFMVGVSSMMATLASIWRSFFWMFVQLLFHALPLLTHHRRLALVIYMMSPQLLQVQDSWPVVAIWFLKWFFRAEGHETAAIGLAKGFTWPLVRTYMTGNSMHIIPQNCQTET